MEVAGRSVAEQVVSLANPKTVGVVAGKGNNGVMRLPVHVFYWIEE